MQKRVGLKDFRERLSTYEKYIQKGGSLVIYRKSEPIFTIAPVDEQWEEVIDFTKIQKGGVSIDQLLNRL